MNSTCRHVRLRDLIAEEGDNIPERVAELSTLPRAELDRRLLAVKVAVQSASEMERKVPPPVRIDLWLINAEYTRRDIPPVFRNLPDLNDDDPDQVADLFAVDLGWLAARHRQHAPLFSRWRGVFKPTTLLSTTDYIAANHPRRPMHWFCKGLTLTDEQQRELHTIKRDGVRREFDHLTEQREKVRVQLAAAYHARDCRHKTDDHAATIERRVSIWFCGSLSGWKPQRTADLFHAYTGTRITRQLAAKIIEQVHRDIPESRPRHTRTRKRRAFSDEGAMYGSLTTEGGGQCYTQKPLSLLAIKG